MSKKLIVSIVILLLITIAQTTQTQARGLPYKRTSTTSLSSLSSKQSNSLSNHQHQQQFHSHLRRPRSACGFFVWDAISAFRYHLCNRLLKDCVYEGLGGKKFVRIKPGSILESLYPPSQHGPDRCLLCGLSFRDHLTCWWYSNLYSPYDLYLDEIRKNGTDTVIAPNAIISKSRRRNGRMKKKQQIKNRTPQYESGLIPFYQPYSDQKYTNDVDTKLIYHQKYVKDISDIDTQTNKVKDNKKRNKRQSKGSKVESSPLFERRKVAGTTFVVPKMNEDQHQEKSRSNGNSSLLFVARNIVLAKLEELIWIEKVEKQSSSFI